MRPLLLPVVAVFTMLLLWTGRARAADADNEEAWDPPWYAGGGLGGFGSQNGGGIRLDVLAYRRIGPFSVGVNANGAIDGLKSSSANLAPTIGAFVPTSPAFPVLLGVVGTLGVRWHHVASNNLLSRDPGRSAATGMYSVRAVVALRLGQKQRYPFGLSVFIDDDLARIQTAPYTYESTGFLGGTSTQTASHRIGTFRAGALLTLGALF